MSCDKVGFWIYFEDRLIEFLDMLDTGEERNRGIEKASITKVFGLRN